MSRRIYFVLCRLIILTSYIFYGDSVKLVEPKTTKCFRIMNHEPDLGSYGLKQRFNKTGITLVQTTLLSHSILSWFK